MSPYESIKVNSQYLCPINGLLSVESVNIFLNGSVTIVLKSKSFVGAYKLDEFLKLERF